MGYRYKADPELTRKQAFEATRNNWEKNKLFKDNVAWSSKGGKQILISQGQFSGYDVGIWQANPYKSLHRRNFNKKSLALSWAKSWMKKHPRG